MKDSNQLQEAIKATKAYKSYLETLNCEPIDKTRAYHLSLDAINQLGALNNTNLNGVRIYLGEHELPNGDKVMRLYIVGTEEKDGSSVDVGVEEGNFAETLPCPNECNIGDNPLYP